MKATASDKKYYFAMRDEIHAYYLKIGSEVSKEGLHEFLKLYADLEGASLETITSDELQQLKEWTKQFALEHCGIDFDLDDGTQFRDDFYHS